MTLHESNTYDLIAIGSGPAGRRAAVQAAKLGKRAAVVEREVALGGVSTNTGTLPSKTLRAAIVDLTARAESVRSQEITIDDLLWRTQQVIEHEREVIHDQLRRNGVTVLEGTASFLSPYALDVRGANARHIVVGRNIVIAVGTRPSRPPSVDFDDRTVVDSDGILSLARIPRTLTVVGAGVIGLEYASMAVKLGVRVTLVDKRASMLAFVDDELVEALQYHLRGLGMTIRLGETVEAVQRVDGVGAMTRLASGELIRSDAVLYAAGRHGATAQLVLGAAGLDADARGRISVDAQLRTAQRHIFAAGDVIGFPSLAASSMEQGRLAALAAFDQPSECTDDLLPYGIYTLPEISFVGSNERELAAANVPYVAGRASYRELPRGEMAGDRAGLLKLLVHSRTRQIVGVHIFGTAATELVHLGQAVIAGSLGVDYLAESVFNVPTFSDAYKVAALDAVARLDELGGRIGRAA